MYFFGENEKKGEHDACSNVVKCAHLTCVVRFVCGSVVTLTLIFFFYVKFFDHSVVLTPSNHGPNGRVGAQLVFRLHDHGLQEHNTCALFVLSKLGDVPFSCFRDSNHQVIEFALVLHQ